MGPEVQRERRRGVAGMVVAALAAVALWWLAVGGDPATACRDDCRIQHAPALAAIGGAWLAGEAPLVDRASWYGGALVAEHQYGALSPAIALPAAVAAAARLDPVDGVRLLVALHLALLGAGLWMLARGRGLEPGFALLAVLAVAGNGYLLTWAASDWLPALTSFAWLPWLAWALDRALAGAARPVAWTAAAGVALALVLLAGWPHGDAMALLWIAVAGTGAAVRRRVAAPSDRSAAPLGRAVLVLLLGCALAAPALLAAAEAWRGGARTLWPAGDEGEWRVPVAALAGWLWPFVETDWQVFLWRRPHAAIELAGSTFVLLGLGLALLRRRRAFLAPAAEEVALLAAATILLVLPGLPAFRWSFRFLPLAALALALAGARGWQELARGTFAAAGRRRRIAWLLAAATAGTSLAALERLPQLDGAVRWPSAPGPGALDPERLHLSLFTRADVVAEPESAAPRGRALDLLPGALPLVAGAELVNGYSPFEPFGFARLLWMRSTGEIHESRARTLLERESGGEGLLAALGVSGLLLADRYLGFESALVAQGWERRGAVEGGARFERSGAPPPRVVAPTRAVCADGLEAQARWLERRPAGASAWVLPCATGEVPGAEIGFAAVELRPRAELRRTSSVEVEVAAGTREGLVVFRRALYPGFRARLDGRELPVVPVDLILPGVRLPAGSRGRLELDYAPSSLSIGAAVAALALLAAALGILRERRATASGPA